jgi:hypothetical protein
MESLVQAEGIRSGRTIDATKVSAEKVHNFFFHRWIAPKFLEEFQLAVFLGVAWNPYSTPMMFVWAVPPTRPEYRL